MVSISPSVVDANVIVRYLVHDNDPLYRRAAAWMSAIKDGLTTAYVPDAVIVECVYVLQRIYKVPRDEIVDSLQPLIALQALQLDDKARTLKSLEVYRQNRSLSFVDAVCLQIALERNWTLETFDLKLAKLADTLARRR